MAKRAGERVLQGFQGLRPIYASAKMTEGRWGTLTEARIERGCRAGSSAAKVGGEMRAAFGDGPLRRSE